MSDLIGLPTHHSRVETWECDFNNHWNTRFYIRSFQMAGEVAATISPGRALSGQRSLHVRFHAELVAGDPVEVRSAVVEGGAHQGKLVHFLQSRGRVVTAALDTACAHHPGLPRVDAEAARMAYPRGIEEPTPARWQASSGDLLTEHGVVRPSETDHHGEMVLDEISRRAGIASHDYLARMGYTLEFMKQTHIGRMLAEMRITVLAPCTVGQRVVISSRLAARGRTSFVMSHALCAPDGTLFSVVDLCMLAADMRTRRATGLPDFLLAASLPEGLSA